MIPLALLGLAGIIAGTIITLAIYNRVSYDWLQYGLTGLVISLPFEQIPSIPIGDATLSINQALTAICTYFVIILVLKKDTKITKIKLNYLFWGALLFFALSIPSWFFISNFGRFAVTMIPTVLVFMAAVLLAHFLEKPVKAIKYLYISLAFACVFAIYQFIGDMINIPFEYTFLNERYTKIVFGFPRVHSTAIEPLYFAGMLFLPTVAFFVYWLAKVDLFERIKLHVSVKNLIACGFFGLFIIAAFSKGAIAIIVGLLGLVGLLWLCNKWSFDNTSELVSIGILGLIALYISIIYIPATNQYVQIIGGHLMDTISGESSTIVERQIFLEAAQTLLPENYLHGIGSGQYGIDAKQMLSVLPREIPGYYIVNNVYVEVLLEFGLASLLIFLGILFATLAKAWDTFIVQDDWSQPRTVHIIILFFTLFGLMIQWLTFSPIYIMPIFIILGLLVNLVTRQDNIVE